MNHHLAGTGGDNDGQRRGISLLASGMALSTQSGMARVLLFMISASSLLSSGARRVTMPQELETFELAWQPWKFFNYSSPSAAKYCKDAYCLR